MKQAVSCLRYWTLRLKLMKFIPVAEATLNNERIDARIPKVAADKVTSLMGIVAELREARNQLRNKQLNDITLRQTYLEELAEAILLRRCPWMEDTGN